MKPSLLLINCYRSPGDSRSQALAEWLGPHFEVKPVHIDELKSSDVKEDAIVVSGSERLLTQEPLPEILKKLSVETTKPLLGVCYGLQALASVWGARITKKKLLERDETIRVITSKGILSNMGLFFTMHESHTEHVVKDQNLDRHFDVLAYSDSCKVEVIVHRERPLWGVQFHPERSGVTGKSIAANFARLIANPKTKI